MTTHPISFMKLGCRTDIAKMKYTYRGWEEFYSEESTKRLSFGCPVHFKISSYFGLVLHLSLSLEDLLSTFLRYFNIFETALRCNYCSNNAIIQIFCKSGMIHCNERGILSPFFDR